MAIDHTFGDRTPVGQYTERSTMIDQLEPIVRFDPPDRIGLLVFRG
jgi:hypothetical protein